MHRSLPAGSAEGIALLKRNQGTARGRRDQAIRSGEDPSFWMRRLSQLGYQLARATRDVRSDACVIVHRPAWLARGRRPAGRPRGRISRRSTRAGPSSDEGAGEPAPPLGGPR